jgi:TPR repeat protein
VALLRQGFLGDLDEAFKREIDPFYRGSERGINAALSLGIAQGAMHGPIPAQSVTQFLESEFLRRGYGADIASAATTALANAITQNNYTDPLGRLQRAADQGSLPAQVTLGNLHMSGKAGLPQSATIAARYYRSAADAGDATALFNMGVLHWTGQGVEQSNGKAIDYFQRAADQEDLPALCNMGILHYHGDGVDQSFGKAFNYFWRAMKQGDTDAAFSLGLMHHRGLGTEV